MTTITAPAGKAVVRIQTVAEQSATGFLLQEKKTSDRARVVASGVPDVAEGDLVLLSGEYAGSSFKVDGADYVTVVAEEILAVLGE